MPELVSHISQAHIVHGHEGGRHDEVEYPLERHGNGHCSATNGIREYFSNQHPADGAPAEHERSTVDHDADNSQHGRKPCHNVAKSHSESTYRHAYGAGDEERLASPFLDRKDSQQREQNIDDTHNDGLNHRVAHSHRLEDTRCEIEYGVDTYRLLEYAQHDTDKDNHPAISEKPFRLFLCRGFDLRQNNLCLSQAVDTAQHLECLIILAAHGKIAWRFGNKQHEQRKDSCRNSLTDKHQTPSCLCGPCCRFGIQNLVDSFNGLYHRI